MEIWIAADDGDGREPAARATVVVSDADGGDGLLPLRPIPVTLHVRYGAVFAVTVRYRAVEAVAAIVNRVRQSADHARCDGLGPSLPARFRWCLPLGGCAIGRWEFRSAATAPDAAAEAEAQPLAVDAAVRAWMHEHIMGPEAPFGLVAAARLEGKGPRPGPGHPPVTHASIEGTFISRGLARTHRRYSPAVATSAPLDRFPARSCADAVPADALATGLRLMILPSGRDVTAPLLALPPMHVRARPGTYVRAQAC